MVAMKNVEDDTVAIALTLTHIVKQDNSSTEFEYDFIHMPTYAPSYTLAIRPAHTKLATRARAPTTTTPPPPS